MGCCGNTVSTSSSPTNGSSGFANRAVNNNNSNNTQASSGRIRATDVQPRAVLSPDVRVSMIKKSMDTTKANMDALKDRISQTAGLGKKPKK